MSSSDPLLPGTGYTPSYGIHDDPEDNMTCSGVASSVKTTTSITSESQGKEKVCVVARCALTACLASLVAGMNAGFTSPALLELQNPNLTTPAQFFSNDSILPSVFAVSIIITRAYARSLLQEARSHS